MFILDSLETTFKGLTNYWYGSDRDYIIVATPVEIECEDGRILYAGATNLESKYKKYFGSLFESKQSFKII